MLELKSDRSQRADYDQDLMLWYEQQHALLRQRRLAELDVDHLIEELDDAMGSLRKELASRLEVLIIHLLKCEYQPERKSRSWLGTIHEQRSALALLLEESPSLAPLAMQAAEKSYPRAVRGASVQTGLDRKIFPAAIPYSRDQLFDDDFVPAPSNFPAPRAP
ncbi:DUF29 domain-containing protein [Massilia sp. R2A-15]|uniref:DUF29 domain-containing protein n=1 Tax=Massilia sp. R2A-15 TaxID=3064278 RepID=UPI0027323589|nr:DUF29 domain-containing protein [Massilia sp. R2A-15]WLI87735.1 DUF29 domain-containing protein [Massilia sp. R2A-15]